MKAIELFENHHNFMKDCKDGVEKYLPQTSQMVISDIYCRRESELDTNIFYIIHPNSGRIQRVVYDTNEEYLYKYETIGNIYDVKYDDFIHFNNYQIVDGYIFNPEPNLIDVFDFRELWDNIKFENSESEFEYMNIIDDQYNTYILTEEGMGVEGIMIPLSVFNIWNDAREMYGFETIPLPENFDNIKLTSCSFVVLYFDMFIQITDEKEKKCYTEAAAKASSNLKDLIENRIHCKCNEVYQLPFNGETYDL